MRSIVVSVILLLATVVGIGQRGEYIARLRQTPPLTIPEEAKRSGLGGEITVWVNLDADGNVVSVESATGPSPICRNVTRPDVVALRQAATEAAKLAKFEPVAEDGKRRLASGVVRFQVPAGKSEMSDGDEKILDLGQLGTPRPESLRLNVIRLLPKPAYPPAAIAVRAAGPVSVRILVDDSGAVFSSEAVTGHPLLRASATQAACEAKFHPTVLDGKPMKMTGIITYNFVP